MVSQTIKNLGRSRYISILTSVLIMGVLFTSCDLLSTDDGGDDTDVPMLEQDIDIQQPSMNGISDSVSSKYRGDAKVIALRYMREHDSTKIVIPEKLIDFYWRGLIHIHNYDHPSRDTVVRHYSIYNARPDIVAHQMLVGVDTSHAWTEAWQNGETETGNESVDNLISEYELTLDPHSVSIHESSMHVVLESDLSINPDALARKFMSEVPDIAYAERNGLGGDGPFIKSSVKKDRVHFTYSLGWGDCPAGCINRRYWDFTVYPGGEVQFEGSYGDEINH